MQTTAAQKPLDLRDLAAPFERMGCTEAVDVARERFGLSGVASRFATEKDDTFLLKAESGRRFILKVGNPGDPRAEVEFQTALLRHIVDVDPTLPVPWAIPDIDGNPQGSIVDGAGQSRQVRLLTYLEGTPLDSVSSTAEQRERIGEVLARLRLATAGFSHPAAHRVLAWDVKNLLGLEYLLAEVEDAWQRKQLSKGLQRFSDLRFRLAGLRAQVLHNDFNKSNIVVDPSSAAFVTGIIDFGDAVHTAIAIDVSTALLGQLPAITGVLPKQDPFADGRDLVRGYLRVADLTDEELAMIPHLVLARVVTRALLSLQLAKRFPENSAYLLRNTGQGWAQLDWFIRRSPSEISAALSTL